MASPADSISPRDRLGDEPRSVENEHKPPVLRRSTIRLISAACLLLILYGTLGPLGLHGGPWLTAVDTWTLTPPWEHSGIQDIVTNLLIYIPVGISLRLLLRRRGGSGVVDFSMGLFLAIGLSYVTEVLQQFMPARASSMMDVAVNSIGALFGCLIALPVQSGVRRLHQAGYTAGQSRPWTLRAWVVVLMTAVMMTVPWTLAEPSVRVRVWRALDLLDIGRFAMFAAMGFALSAAALEPAGSRWVATLRGLLRAVVIALVFEGSQTILAWHVADLQELLIAWAGALTGCLCALVALESIKERERRWRMSISTARKLAVILLVGAVVYLVADQVAAHDRSLPGAAKFTVRIVPFEAHFLKPLANAVADIAETLALYAFLTVISLFISRGTGRAVALLLVIAVVGLIESYQALFNGGVFDTTPLLLAVVAWLITSRIWNALDPQPLRR